MLAAVIDLLAVVAAASLLLRSFTLWIAWAHTRRPVAPLKAAVGISVLKPMRGLDDGLADNLRSLLRQDYPGEVEFVLGTTDYADPALVVARALQREFPEHAIRIVVSPPDTTANPKVANLMGLTSVAAHDVLLVSDANVRVGPTYLRDMVAELADVGLVANLVAGVEDASFGAVLENLQLNGFTHAAVSTAMRVVDHPCVIGKSLLMRRADLEATGGWRALGAVLGEDYAMGQAFVQAGLAVRISSHVVPARSDGWTVTRFIERHLRWHQMRRWIAPGMYALEPVMYPCLWLVAAALAAGLGAQASTWIGPLCVGALWAVAIEALHARILRGAWPPLRYTLATPVKDLLVVAIWTTAWVRREVSWRGHRYRIGPGSALWPTSEHAPVAEASSSRCIPVSLAQPEGIATSR